MALTATERKRRQRAHEKGDHSLCDPDRRDCHDVTPAEPDPPEPDVTPNVTPDDVDGYEFDGYEFGAGGRRLWRELNREKTLTPAERVLAEEACRVKDRCDRFERMLRGREDEWMRLTMPEADSTELVLTIDRMVSEARMQGLALKQVLSELRQMRTATAAPAAGTPKTPAPDAGGGGADGGGGTILDLARAIAAKRSAATG